MRDFKFFSKNDLTDYHGEMAQEAIGFVQTYTQSDFSVNYAETELARYTIDEVRYHRGDLSSVVVATYPNQATSIRILFNINIGRVVPFITSHTIDYDRI